MVRVDNWIWTEARERTELGASWGLRMLLVAQRVDPTAVCELFEDVLGRRAYDNAAESIYPGHWTFEVIDGRVCIDVWFGEHFETVLRALIAAVDQHGIDATLSLWPPSVSRRAPATAPVIWARVTENGQRLARHEAVPGAQDWYTWLPDSRQFLEKAVDWCGWQGEATAYLSDPNLNNLGDDLVALDRSRPLAIHANHADLPTRRVFATRGPHFRSVAFHRHSGRVALATGRDDGQVLDWQHESAALEALLIEHAELLVYGAIARGTDVVGALSPTCLPTDWPRRPHEQPTGGWNTPSAFDDLFVPDAFGIQLLGPWLETRARDLPGWGTQAVGDRRTILRHPEPHTWLGTFDRLPLAVLEQARENLAPLLYMPGALAKFGFSTVDSA